MSNDVDFIFSNYLRVKLDDKLFETIDSSCCRVEFYDREQIAHAFLNRSITIICPSILVRKRFLVDKGLLYPEGCPFSEDQYFIWRLIAMSSSCVQICERLYYYVSRPSSIMNSSKIESFLGGWSWFSSLEKELEEIGGLPFSASIVADRWLLGALHTAAKLLSYDSFARFFNETKAKGRVGKQEWTNDKRAFVTVACIRLLPLPVVYQLLRNV